MSRSQTADAGATTLVLPAEITFGKAAACRDMLVQGLDASAGRRSGPVVADASALAVFDSSALAVLLDCRREALVRGRAFAVRSLHDGLAGLAKLYGVDTLLPAG
ncbi:STAS domain-containing protein [Xylophilus sp.]|uniref:STAS domain-containing protein n=1 Tax=Xylophilus sp. TaxID=2653893 RepID=UPI0013BA8ED3|nr:STAS domain-containing protein [Xylophilus sp.]KAF1045734.1 MAG: hypothetical protein GAK38_02870 [Xylophilus sp.]